MISLEFFSSIDTLCSLSHLAVTSYTLDSYNSIYRTSDEYEGCLLEFMSDDSISNLSLLAEYEEFYRNKDNTSLDYFEEFYRLVIVYRFRKDSGDDAFDDYRDFFFDDTEAKKRIINASTGFDITFDGTGANDINISERTFSFEMITKIINNIFNTWFDSNFAVLIMKEVGDDD